MTIVDRLTALNRQVTLNLSAFCLVLSMLVVSADATPAQIHRVMAAGAEAYLTKPFDIRELLAIVDRFGGAL